MKSLIERIGKPYRRSVDDVIQWLPINSLKIADYQRRISVVKLRRLIQTFDINKVGVLAVNQRNGCYFLIDGQHRCEAAKTKGYKRIPCLIYRDLSKEEEATLRLAFGTRKADTTYEIFNLKLGMKDPDALAIKKILEDVGLNLILRPGGHHYHDPKAITCIGALQQIYKGRTGSDLLRRTLVVSLRAWPDDQHGRGHILLLGLKTFLQYYPEIDDATLVSRLSLWPPNSLQRRARQWVQTGERTGYEQVVARLILAEYNKRRSVNRLPDRFVRQDFTRGEDGN